MELAMKFLKGDECYGSVFAEIGATLGEIYASEKKWEVAEEKYKEVTL